jgi:hypothetical protein
MSERERGSEVIEIDNDITSPGTSKDTNRTVTDEWIKNPSHEDFVTAWSEAVFGKGLTFDFFSDTLVRKDILVTVQCADSSSRPPALMGKILFCPEGPLGLPKFCLRPMIVCSRRSCGSWPHFTRK